MANEADAGRGIKSVEVFGRILSGMTRAAGRPSLDGIAHCAGISSAKVRPYLNSLQRTGLAVFDPVRRVYSFGPLASRLGQRRIERMARQFGFVEVSQRIAQHRDLFVGIVFWAGGTPTVASVIPSRTSAGNNVLPGTVYSVTGTATGWVFHAFSSDPEVAARADAELAGTALPRGIGELREGQSLEALTTAVREQGYGFVRDAYFPGYNGLALPVLDQRGDLICVIAVSGTSRALSQGDAPRLANEFQQGLRDWVEDVDALAEEGAQVGGLSPEDATGADPVGEDRRGVGSAETASRILRAMTASGNPMKLKEICDLADIAAARAHSYMVSLRRCGLVEHAPGSHRYQLGPLAAEMLLVRLHGYDVFEVARTLVHDLARETGLMCFLTTWGTYGPVVTDIDRGLVTRHTDVYLGRNLPLSSSGTGRLFQANARPGAVAQALAAESAVHPELQDKAPKPEELAEILADIRAAGYATFELGPPIGLRSLVAPVYNHMGEMWFAVTLTGEAERVHAQEAHFLARLLSGVRAISADLGYSAPR